MSIWSQASRIAAQTPEARNRLVDFLRAASILAVISGHWLVSAPYADAEGAEVIHMLAAQTWTQWLSWGFQVMPIFFLVGGYANAVSWRAAIRDYKPFSTWLDSRLRRLLVPVLPLILTWVVVAVIARSLGADVALLQELSRIALIPIWFLAIYTIIVLLVPLTHAMWQRFGFGSFFVPVALAVIDDVLFIAGYEVLGWFNYVFIWVAVHQLGYAWRDGRINRPAARFGFGCLGLCLLCLLTLAGPYPIAMIGVPGDAVGNTLPPKLPLLALGIAQAGFILAAEAPLRRWLDRPAPWTLTVLLNGMIMTIYLWHSTAFALVATLAMLAGNLGLSLEPGSEIWWLMRPIWIALYAIALAAMMPLVARFERMRAPLVAASTWRQVTGSMVICAGLAVLAYNGIGGDVSIGLQVFAALMPFAGAMLAGQLSLPHSATPTTG